MSQTPSPTEQIQQLTRHLLAQNQSCAAAEAAESVLIRLADLQDTLNAGRPEAPARIAEYYRRYYLEASES